MNETIWFNTHKSVRDLQSNTNEDELFLSEGNLCQDLADNDYLYDEIERLSTIYISKHHHNIHVKSSLFSENFGTYGGAITINAFSAKYGNST